MDQDELKNEPIEPDKANEPEQVDMPIKSSVDSDVFPSVDNPTEPAVAAPPPRPVAACPSHVLAPTRYKLKSFLMFMDFIAIIAFIYFLMIRSMMRDVAADTFSFSSNRMFSFYCVVGITVAAAVVIGIFKFTKSAQTRFARSNEVRQDPNVKVWLTGFDWGWPVLFLPTMVLMFAAGASGILLNFVLKGFDILPVIQNVIGGVVLVVASLNAAVVIFKLKPVVLGLLAGSALVGLLIMLLHGHGTFLAFFKSFRLLGISIEPRGYILLAYIWSVFLRIIWLKGLFFYWVFLPNRLELQHGLSESNDSVDRDDLRHKIDTDDVILRWWNVGIITFYFPELDRLPITNVVWGIRKKAVYANRIASIKSMSD
jgi:hypothetical protein